MHGLLERNAAIVTSPRGFLALIATTLALLALIRAFLFPGVGGDDGEQLVFSQFFDWGYQLRNPPLVTWLLIGLQELTGPTVFSIVLLRGLALFAVYALSFGVALELLGERRIAALSAGSLLMIFQVGWNTIHGFTHTTFVTAFYLAALYLVLRLGRAPSVWGRVLFGAVLGFGLMAKYSFALFALALVIAALFERDLRRAILSPWVALGVALSLPVVVLQLTWLVEQAPSHYLVRGEVPLSLGENALRILKTLLRVCLSVVGFVMPFAVLRLAVFWRAVRSRPKPEGERAARLRFLERMLMIIAIAAFGAIAIIQADRPRSHYLFVLVPFVPYLFLRFGAAFTAVQIRRYAALVTLSAVVLVTALVTKYFVEPLICGHCEDHVPYDSFARQLRDAGFKGGTIFAYFHKEPLAGNLRVRFPHDRIVSAKHPKAIPPKRQPPGQCLVVWPVKGSVEPKSATVRGANESPLATKLPYDYPSRVITAPLSPWGKRPQQLEFLIVEGGAGGCR